MFDNESTGFASTGEILSKIESKGKLLGLVKGDLLERKDLDAVFSQYDIDAVIHFAAFSQVAESMGDPSKYYRNNVGGTMSNMSSGVQQTHLEFRIPTRGIMGHKTRILNVTHGEAVFYHNFLEYGPYAGDITGRQNGAMISMSTEKAVAYALGTLQERGQLFVGPGDECYEGMLVGERSKPGDMVVNIARTKSLGNQRSSTADISVQLTPPRTYTLEEALEYIMDDELVEITPKSIRMRKRILNETERRKWRVKNGLVNK